MFRDRTNLFISYRQSYAHHPQFTPASAMATNGSEEQQGLMSGAEGIAIEMDTLPPAWLDMSQDVDDSLSEIQRLMNQLESLHRKNALPGFDDRTQDEHKIESLTYDITQRLHGCQDTMKRFEHMSANPQSAAEAKMAANMKISLATRIQEKSTGFRKMQSSYLKSLRNDSYSTSPSPYPGSYDPILEDEMDVTMSQHALQAQSQSQVPIEDESIRQREAEITKIAQSILELADIFKDLQTMVIDQGTLLDRIDYNIETMYTHVKQADKELVQATHYQKRTQKCKIILLLCLLVVALFIILMVKPRRHSSGSAPPPAPAPTRPTVPSDGDSHDSQ
uniref:ARAD1A07810p n=1 Tax=Blastobotrys adeninivorans TaxID=409370 RepID=A0A060T2E9_BLAAD